MGARNSIQQTMPLDNPHPQENQSIQISPEVAMRLSFEQRAQLYDNAKTIYNENKCNCKPQEITEQDALLHKSAIEMQEEQFAKTVMKMEDFFGKPIEWTPEERSETNKLREEVIQCYKHHPKEPLRCKQLADDFHGFVFKQYMKNMLREMEKMQKIAKEKEKNKEKTETEERYKRAGPCGGRNNADDSHIDTGIHVGGSCKSPTDPPDLQNVKNEWEQKADKEKQTN